MRVAILAILGLAALALAQTPPTVAPSFTATTAATFGNRTFTGLEYVDAQNQRSAFDHKFTNGDLESDIEFTANRTAYHFGTYNGTAYCREQPDPRPWFNQFDWVAHSTSTGSCTVGSQSGQGWKLSSQQGTLTLCASGNIPLQVTFDDGHGHTESTVYTQFVPGVPAVTNFYTPGNCNHHQ